MRPGRQVAGKVFGITPPEGGKAKGGEQLSGPLELHQILVPAEDDQCIARLDHELRARIEVDLLGQGVAHRQHLGAEPVAQLELGEAAAHEGVGWGDLVDAAAFAQGM